MKYIMPFLVLAILMLIGVVESLTFSADFNHLSPEGFHGETWGIVQGFRDNIYPVLYVVLFACVCMILIKRVKASYAKYFVPCFVALMVVCIFGFVEYLSLLDDINSQGKPDVHSEIWGVIQGFRFSMYPILLTALLASIGIFIALFYDKGIFFSYILGIVIVTICLFCYFQFRIVPDLTSDIEKNPVYFADCAKLRSNIYSIAYPILGVFFILSSVYVGLHLHKQKG